MENEVRSVYEMVPALGRAKAMGPETCAEMLTLVQAEVEALHKISSHDQNAFEREHALTTHLKAIFEQAAAM